MGTWSAFTRTPFSSRQIQIVIGMVKTLQHGGNLTREQEKAYDEITEDGSGWFQRIWSVHVPSVDTDKPVVRIRGAAIPKSKELKYSHIRVALKSMRKGNPTFMDQEISREFVNYLFQLYRDSCREEEAIGRVSG
jgi:hypothetical protein